MATMSITNSTLIFNGTTISGFSEDTDAITVPDIIIAAVKRGADGKMIATSTGNVGGEVAVKLLSTSDSVKFLASIATQQKQGSNVNINGSLTNHDTGASCRFTNGIITSDPTFPSFGKGEVQNMNYLIEFESIDGNFESANFN